MRLLTKDKKKILTRKINDKAITRICDELGAMNWESYIDTHCNDCKNVNSVFNFVHTKICESVNKYAPIKERFVNTCKYNNELWMTTGIKQSSQKSKRLYNMSLEQIVDPRVRETYVEYRNCLNKVKRSCKVCYFKNYCQT